MTPTRITHPQFAIPIERRSLRSNAPRVKRHIDVPHAQMRRWRGRFLWTVIFWLSLGGLPGPSAVTAQTVCGNGIVEPGEACDDGNTTDGDCCSAGCTMEPDGGLCDDRKDCTVEDACRSGACVGTPTDAPCALGLEPLVCYKAAPADTSNTSFTPLMDEPVLDEFRSTTPEDPQQLDLRKPIVACSAASPTAAGRQHYEGYVARAARRVLPLRRTMTLQSRAGTTTVTLLKPRRLLVLSGLTLGEDGAQPPTDQASRFTCYRAALAGPFTPTIMALTDVRGGPWAYELGQPTTVCVPELESAQGLNAAPRVHPGYFTCHRATAIRANPPEARAAGGLASTANRYGDEVLALRKASEICLPSVVPAPPPAPRFAFETAPGEVNAALKTILDQGREAPRTGDDATAAQQEISTATETIQRNLAPAQAALLAALQSLAPNDTSGHIALVPLVKIAGGSPEILKHLGALLLAAPPDPATHEVSDDELVRHLALQELNQHARNGSEEAKAHILAAVQSEDRGIRSLAVANFYALSSSRRQAQGAMRALLPVERRYLLYSE